MRTPKKVEPKSKSKPRQAASTNLGQAVKIGGKPVKAKTKKTAATAIPAPAPTKSKSKSVTAQPEDYATKWAKENGYDLKALAAGKKAPVKTEAESKAPAIKRDPAVHKEYDLVADAKTETYDGYFTDLMDAEQADGRGYAYFAGQRIDLRECRIEDNPDRPGRRTFTTKVKIGKREVTLILYD